MKTNKLFITLLSIASFSLFSCEDTLLSLNVPLAPTEATPAATFVSGSAFMGIGLESINENDALLAQYWAGGPGVSIVDFERYFFQSNQFNGPWSSMYLQALSDLKYTIDNGNGAQAAAANMLSVAIYQILVDHYGDIPYSEALSGAPEDGGIVTPAYDDDAAVYASLITRITDATTAMSNTNDELGNEDLIYGGDASKWVKFGNSLKLRLLMRQSIVDNSVSAAVISLIQSGTFIDSDADMAAIPFGGEEGQNFNPQYARREAGVGQFYCASKTTTDYLDGLNDSRVEKLYDFATATGTIVGLAQGGIQQALNIAKADLSYPSEVAYKIDNSVILMSPWEVKFLRAEADMRFGTADDAKTMFDGAVQAHFTYVGAGSAAAYLASDANYNNATTTSQRSNLIGIQKWIAMNGLQESEGWVEARRFDTSTGGNVFTNTTSGIFEEPASSVLPAGVFPSIYLYPQSEKDFNATNVPARVITDKVFWDN